MEEKNGNRGVKQVEGSIVVVPQKLLIGVSFSGTFPALVAEMPKVWEIFLQRQPEIAQVIDPHVRYDISSENQKYQFFTEYIAVEVEAFAQIPEGMVGLTLPEKTYARFRHEGPMEQVQQTYLGAFQWVKDNGHLVDEQALRMERYDDRFVPSVHASERKENAYEIYLPLSS
jgi:AraC family transcriptional regulator